MPKGGDGVVSKLHLVLYQSAPLFCLVASAPHTPQTHGDGQNKVQEACHLFDKEKKVLLLLVALTLTVGVER